MTFEQAIRALKTEVTKGAKWSDFFEAVPARGYETPSYRFTLTGEVVPRTFFNRTKVEFEGEPLSHAEKKRNVVRGRADDADRGHR